MPTYVVSYDLVRPGQDYAPLTKYLKSQSNWWHHLGSSWVVVSPLTSVQLRDGITDHIDENDKVLIVQSSGTGAWAGFNSEGSSWLKEHL